MLAPLCSAGRLCKYLYEAAIRKRQICLAALRSRPAGRRKDRSSLRWDGRTDPVGSHFLVQVLVSRSFRRERLYLHCHGRSDHQDRLPHRGDKECPAPQEVLQQNQAEEICIGPALYPTKSCLQRPRACSDCDRRRRRHRRSLGDPKDPPLPPARPRSTRTD
jgi:hypothetical protein